jgi:hypothetical protein
MIKGYQKLFGGLLLAAVALAGRPAGATDDKSYMGLECRVYSGSGAIGAFGQFTAGAAGATVQCAIVRDSMGESIEYLPVFVRDNDVAADFACRVHRRGDTGSTSNSTEFYTSGTTGGTSYEKIEMFYDPTSVQDTFDPTDFAAVMLICDVPANSIIYKYVVAENE